MNWNHADVFVKQRAEVIWEDEFQQDWYVLLADLIGLLGLFTHPPVLDTKWILEEFIVFGS